MHGEVMSDPTPDASSQVVTPPAGAEPVSAPAAEPTDGAPVSTGVDDPRVAELRAELEGLKAQSAAAAQAAAAKEAELASAASSAQTALEEARAQALEDVKADLAHADYASLIPAVDPLSAEGKARLAKFRAEHPALFRGRAPAVDREPDVQVQVPSGNGLFQSVVLDPLQALRQKFGVRS